MVSELELAIYGIVAVGILYFVVLRGLFQIRDNQVGILTKTLGGAKMPQGQVIARHGQIGIQAQTLVPGWYYRFPLFWRVHRAPIVVIQPEEVGVMEAIDGLPLPQGRLLGNETESNQFQDAEKFLENGGFKGPQVGLLRPGRYRINTSAFNVVTKPKTIVDATQVGLVTAQDGLPLPPKLRIAPPATKSNNFFQDGQSFIEGDGYRGTQLDVLQAGQYYINPYLFNVELGPVAEVKPGFVAVLRSNVGEELERTDTRPTPPGELAGLGEKLTHDVEQLLITDKTKRGILETPIAPGKYPLNTYAYSAYLVPTGAITIDWASTDRPASPSTTRPPVMPSSDDSSNLYVSTQTAKGVDFFQFNQLRITSKDGFQLEVDVRMVIRILPENAAFVIARFGTVFNLIQGIVHPLIDASFRNKAGEKGALDFVQSRTQLQAEALAKAKTEFADYHVEAQNLLISYILVPEDLLDTQTKKQIAMQQQAQYVEQARAEEQRIAVQAKTAMANKQPDVIAAQLEIQINENRAKAQVAQAVGQRDATKTIADGNQYQVRVAGEAQAAAYKAQSDVIGSDKVAMLGSLDRLQKIQPQTITPQILVTSGIDGKDSTSSMFGAYLATLMAKPSGPTTSTYEAKEHKDYESPLAQPATTATATPIPASTPETPSMTVVETEKLLKAKTKEKKDSVQY